MLTVDIGMSFPQPKPAPPFIPADRGEDGQHDQAPPAPTDTSLMYTVVAPAAPARPSGPPPWAPPPGRGPLPYPPRRRTALINPQVARVLIAGLALVCLVLGITLDGPIGIGWDAFLAWSIFASAAAIAVLAGAASEHRTWSWGLQFYGVIGLLIFWLIAARPIAPSNVGFLMTFGTALAVLSAVRNPFRPPWRAIFGPRQPRRR